METAWVRNGSIVLECPSHQGYGVEVGGDPSGMVQLRTVRFGGSDLPNAEADKTAETEFCSSFDKLRDGIAGAGGDIAIVRALGVGTTPVKRVSAPTAEVATDARSGRTCRPNRCKFRRVAVWRSRRICARPVTSAGGFVPRVLIDVHTRLTNLRLIVLGNLQLISFTTRRDRDGARISNPRHSLFSF